MALSRIFSTVLSAAALVAPFACAGVAYADTAHASLSTGTSATVHASSLPPIVPLAALLGMSSAAGVVGVMAGRRGRVESRSR